MYTVISLFFILSGVPIFLQNIFFLRSCFLKPGLHAEKNQLVYSVREKHIISKDIK